MESIKFIGRNELYDILKLQLLPDNTLQIVFDDTPPETFGDFEAFTKSGTKYATITGYEKIISVSEESVILAKADYNLPEEIESDPTAEEDLMAMVVDNMYAITLLELGVI